MAEDVDACLSRKKVHLARPAMWSLPGGLIDVGELVENAAVREVYEETGIKVRVLKDATLGASASVSPSFCQTEHIIYDDKDACEYHYILAHLVSIAESPTSDIVANDDVSDAMFVDCEKLLDGSFEKDNPKFKLTPKTKDIVELAVAVLPRYK